MSKRGYILSVILLFFYSFTQIDLGLTFSSTSFFLPIQQAFQQIGYFQRDISTALYVSIFLILFILYSLLYISVRRGSVPVRTLWFIIGSTAAILILSYPAFSYDIYNYMFDAKIVTTYGENPYVHKALDYPADPWLSFMRWTHRTYPYGPAWLGITIPLSYLGMQKFIVTLYLFKMLMTASYLACAYGIYKILKKIQPKHAVSGTVLFALNPLVLSESLVSAHNDIVMMMCAVWSFYFLIRKKPVWALLLLTISIGIKFATVFLVPVYAFVLWKQFKEQSVDWDRMLWWGVILMTAAVFAASVRTQFQPWYTLFVFPFIALLPEKKHFIFSMFVFTVCGLLMYVPYLFTGNWDPPIPTILAGIVFTSVIVSLARFFIVK